MLGKNENVLIEGLSKRNSKELMGRTQNNRVVNLIGTTNLIGKIVPVLITDVKKHSLGAAYLMIPLKYNKCKIKGLRGLTI